MKPYGIIYKATCKITGMSYYGRTIQKFDTRKIKHKSSAMAGTKKDKFHIAIKEYGWENFIWEIIYENIPFEILRRKEKELVVENNTVWPNGYNSIIPDETNLCRQFGEKNGMYGKHPISWIKGKKHTEESKRKMSEAKKGKKPSEKTRQKMSESKRGNKNNLGKHHSDSAKQKMSEAHKGENNHFYGKHHTEESKRKMSEIHKGKRPWNKGKRGGYV
jgi:group I intron endonuclease